jgi:hypothetical protein
MTVSIKDYLSGAGTTLEIVAPAPVIRAAFQANLITRADVWMDALETPNKRSHTYDELRFLEATHAIKSIYILLFLKSFLKNYAMNSQNVNAQNVNTTGLSPKDLEILRP